MASSLSIFSATIGKFENNAPKKSETAIIREVQNLVDDCKAFLASAKPGSAVTPARANLRKENGGDTFANRMAAIISQNSARKAGRLEVSKASKASEQPAEQPEQPATAVVVA